MYFRSFALLSVMCTSIAAANTSCPDDDSGLSLPTGFCATIFADGIGHARHLAVSANGVVYVNTWSGVYYGNDTPPAGGFLIALKDSGGKGRADTIQRFGESVQGGGAGGTGIGLYHDGLYAEINDKIVRYSLTAGSLTPRDPPQVVVSGLPLGGDHPMHPFIIDGAGLMYVDVGSATNSCQLQNRTLESPGAQPCTELETRGGIWRYDANKRNQTFSPAERFATGIRNGEGFAIDSGQRIFVTQHGRDQLHSNWPAFYELEKEATLPAEEVMRLEKGGDFGWPECYFDPAVHKLVLAPEYGGDGKKIGECANKIGPVAAFPAHWAPDGMTYYDKPQFPAHYRNGLFIAFHGSWNRAPYPQKGYNVVFQALAGGAATGKCEIFADGFAGTDVSPDKAAHRPTGLAVGPDGSLFVSDDVRGRIYRIVYRGGTGPEAAGRAVPCPSAAAPAGAIVVLDASASAGGHAGVPDASTLPVPEGATRESVLLGDRIYHGREGGATCTGCHGAGGTGTPLGPNLTANRWFWSDGSNTGIAASIRVGVPHPRNYRAAMPPMGGARLTAEQVSAVANYVWALNQPAADAPAGGAAAPPVIAIPGEKIYPESITAAPDGRLFIGSIVARRIYAVKAGGAAAVPWIGPDGETSLGVYGVFADPRSNTLFACFSSYPGSNKAAQAPSALSAYDLQTGKLKTRYLLPTPGAFCNDIAVGPDGTAYVTDTENMEIDRLKNGDGRLTVWAGNGSFGPKGGVLDGISVVAGRVIVNTLETSKVYAVPINSDGSAGAISELALSRPILEPDGMRKFGEDGVLIIESGGAGRLSRLVIKGNSGTVTTLKEGYPDGPVSVAVVGTTGYVLEGQLGALFGPARPAQPSKPFHATAVEVGKP
jgi:glucose/arabinose dehydrogenase/mono/diheme cytochrome c family protein/sugar lactone lactonase YvrE